MKRFVVALLILPWLAACGDDDTQDGADVTGDLGSDGAAEVSSDVDSEAVQDTTPDSQPDITVDTSIDTGQGQTEFDETERRAAANEIREALEGQGYSVTEGCFYLFEVQDCGNMVSCFGNNPTSPYGLYAFPNVGDAVNDSIVLPHYQTADCLGIDEEEVDEDYYAAWHVREDEGFLFFGRTPPESVYFGQTTYLFDRPSTLYSEDPETERTITFASLGDTLNYLRVQTAQENPFDADIALITAADQQTYDDIAEAVLETGVDESLLNQHVIPLATEEYQLQMGWGEDTDVFSWIWRMAIFSDPTEGDAYQTTGQSPVLVFRITPDVEREANPMSVPDLITRGTGVTEADTFSGLEAALDELETAIRGAHSDIVGVNPETEILELTGPDCIVDGTNCLGDNRDAAYYRNLTGRRLANDEYFVVFGVNHEETGHAIYSNMSVYYAELLLGIDSITSPNLLGSSHPYLPDTNEFRDQLFVLEVRRDCQSADYCLEVPIFEQAEDGLITTPGLPEDAMAVFVERGYVDLDTEVGPGLDR